MASHSTAVRFFLTALILVAAVMLTACINIPTSDAFAETATHLPVSTSIDVDGDILLLGDTTDSENGVGSGAAFVYAPSTPRRWDKRQKLIAPDGDSFDNFGAAVVVGEGILVVSAPKDNDAGELSGSVYIFTGNLRDGWVFQSKLLAPDGETVRAFGHLLALEGDILAVGARDGLLPAYVYIFERASDGAWREHGRLEAPQDSRGSRFGASFSLSGDLLVVGAPYDDDAGSSAGATYLFSRQTSGTWRQRMKLVLYENGKSARFGDSVSVDGSMILVGAPGDATHSGESRSGPRGEVYIYTLTKNGVLQSRLQADREEGYNFGAFVQAKESSVIVGGKFPGLHGSDNFGGIWIFDKESYASYTSLGIVGFTGNDLWQAAAISADGETVVTRNSEGTYIHTRN